MKWKTEVIKHSAAIHIQNNISLLQRCTWNNLLAHAYDELDTAEEHHVPVIDLLTALQFNSNNQEYLKEAIVALTTCGVIWDVLDKDGKPVWGVMNLLAQAEIKDGILTYAFPPKLRRELYNPRMYARISLSIQNKFDSKHAQALWELCVDYFDENRACGETPWISIDDYRTLMGIGTKEYPRFARLNERVIKAPVDQINRLTDFFVVVVPKRESRTVSHIKFKITKKLLQITESGAAQTPLFPALEDAPLVWELQQLGIGKKEAWEIWQKEFEYVNPDKRPDDIDFDTYVHEKIDLYRRKKMRSGFKESGTGYLISAIKENYANPEFAEERRKKDQAKQAGERRASERRRQALDEERTRLEQDRRANVHALCERLISDSPALLDDAIQAVLIQNEQFKKTYQSSETSLQNYEKSPFLRAMVDSYLEEKNPDHFQSVRDTFDDRIREIGEKLPS
jgi:hypothetical protein